MAVLSDYTSGTITLANGSTAVTGTGTLFNVAKFREGDTLQIQNLTAVIASVNSNISLTLTVPWTGTSLTDAPYRARYLPDGARVTAQTTTLIELLGNGVLSNIAELGVEDGKAPVGNAAGEYELKSVPTDPNGSLGKLADLTLANRQVLQTDGSGNLTAITLSSKQILQTDANGSLTPLSLVANKMLVTNSSSQVALVDDKSVRNLSTTNVASSVAYVDVTIPSGFDVFELYLKELIPVNNAVALQIQFSTDGGSSFYTGADYRTSAISVTGTASGGFAGGTITNNVQIGNDISNVHGFSTRISVYPGSPIGRPAVSSVTGLQSSFGYKLQIAAGLLITVMQRITTIRVFFNSGNAASGKLILTGA
ncbi:hypothetical protein [Brucella rhizosphaerae]|uniref:Uncharacterized protein n=1 Tax=Brucella rhizosphaerae TaxID=571254 RepID=A0A256FL32_9HYPH|nr:hypothetical protein [Brucella rhizosphaerae]OYR15552.1 hypothetical protein CEV32_4828 [Brucella rhizosphaerae]